MSSESSCRDFCVVLAGRPRFNLQSMRHENPKSRPAQSIPEDGRKRVAIMLDLDWPFRRHFDVLVGTQDFARKREDWLCVLDEFTDVSLRENSRAYDGVIARATSRLAKEAQQ